MEQIMDEYGRVLLDILAVGLLVIYLFVTVKDGAGNQGVLNIIGAEMQELNTDYENYSDFKVYAVESEKAAPALSYDTSAMIWTGRCKLTDYIKAVDYNGKEIPVQVVKVWGPDGGIVTDSNSPDALEVDFVLPGIYTAEVYAIDDVNKKTVCRVAIPVNGRR